MEFKQNILLIYIEAMENNIYNNSINDNKMENPENKQNNVEICPDKPREKTKQELVREARIERLAKAREKLKQLQIEKQQGFKKNEIYAENARRYPKDLNLRKLKELTPEERIIDTENRYKEQLKRNQQKEEIKRKKMELQEKHIKEMEEEEEEEIEEEYKPKKKPIYYESDSEDDEIQNLKKQKLKQQKNKPLKKISIKYYHEPTEYELNQDQLMIQREQLQDLEKMKYKENQKKINEENENKKKELSQFDKLKKLMLSGDD